jgi:pyrroline-5-carboxylate reductase
VERVGQAQRTQALRTEIARLAATLDADLRDALAQDAGELHNPIASLRVAFIGGGNMATALLKGLLRAGAQAPHLAVVEPVEAQRSMLARDLGVQALPAPDATLQAARVIVLAVKPQSLRAACAQLQPHLSTDAVVVSVAAGIRASDIARWLGTQAVVRTMPNTPALIAQGVTGMAALPGVAPAQRALAESLLASAGPVVWFDDEAQLDAVTAVSGSGPAYVFYFIEALMQAGAALGFTPAQARTLAIATFTGAAQLAAQSDEPPGVLRERVTSKGGTTAAALAVLGEAQVDAAIVRAVHAAEARARAMAAEFGRD